MATPEEVLRLRDYVAEPDDTNGWTDYRLETYIDEATNLYNAAAAIWGVKAGLHAGLVNVAESGSSRSLSDLFKQAESMRKHYQELGSGQDNAALSVPIIRQIRRGA